MLFGKKKLCCIWQERKKSGRGSNCTSVAVNNKQIVLFVFLALQPIVIVFSQPGSGL